MSAPFTLTAIGARIAWCCRQEQDHEVNHSDEKLALTDLAFVTPAASLAEAAVLCDVAFGALDTLAASETNECQLQRAVDQLQRALASIGMTVCASAGLDPDEVAWGELRDGYARAFGAVAT